MHIELLQRHHSFLFGICNMHEYPEFSISKISTSNINLNKKRKKMIDDQIIRFWSLIGEDDVVRGE